MRQLFFHIDNSLLYIEIIVKFFILSEMVTDDSLLTIARYCFFEYNIAADRAEGVRKKYAAGKD